MLGIMRKILLTVITLMIGGFAAISIIKMKPKAELKPQVNLGLLVEAQRYEVKQQSAVVIGQGVIEPSERVNLIAQVSGVVKKIHGELSVGGLVKKGNRLLQIDPTDYSLAVREAKARVKIAKQELSLEAGRRQAATQEWSIMQSRGGGGSVSEEAKARALRAPQAAIAESNLKIAKNALARAQVGYGRTLLKASFNAVVISESVDLGQLVGPGAPIATLAGTDTFWVIASVPTSELGWIDFPQRGKRTKRRGKKKRRLGSKVKIQYDIGVRIVEREGQILRQLTQVETTGRMARVVIEVQDPLGLKSDQPSLLLGAQVEVHILGRDMGQVIEIPRAAIHNENELWVFIPEGEEGASLQVDGIKLENGQRFGTLEVRKVKILRKRKETVVIREGVGEDDYIITSRLSTPVPGMRLRGAL
jgi:RND family efflux transporter MFP subunit